MDRSRWERIELLFDQALERPADMREAFVRGACGTDSEMAAEVIGLLNADTTSHSLLDGVAADHLDLVTEFSLEGRTIGAWKLAERIGAGGMGAVYLARRSDGQFEQRAALKIIKRGVESEEVRQRFDAERAIVARLDHHGIARLLDGGVTDDGLPYFTMEYVDGTPIDRYCDEHRLGVDQRLGLFEMVCDAVRYAQRHLVVHRDLKPGNILVTADGKVKLLDFGIAKMIGDNEEHLTRTGARLMTPAYAAPEQVRGEPVTTATDVYALGVILYELLAGHRPYAMKTQTPLEYERAILESDPERPSTAVSRREEITGSDGTTTVTTAETVSSNRGTRPEILRKRLRGDLDNICLMALRKEPERRYSSADQLLQDVRRYRTGRPVVAHSDTLGYRVRKFVKRNAPAVAASMVAVITVASLVVYYTSSLALERNRAMTEARKAEQVTSFLTGIFQVADPNDSPGATVTARELLDTGADRIARGLKGQPEVEARMLATIGQVYTNLGLFAPALEHLTRGLALLESLEAPPPRALVETMIPLASVLNNLGEYARADSVTIELIRMAESSLDPIDLFVGEAYMTRGILMAEMGRAEEAETNYRKVVALFSASTHKEAPKRRLIALNNQAVTLHELGRHEESRAAFEEALSGQRRIYGEYHPEVATTMYNYGTLLRDMGDYAAAETVLTASLAMDRRVYGENHPDVAYTLLSVGILKHRRGDYGGALELMKESLELRQRVLEPGHQNIGFSAYQVCLVYTDLDRFAEAESLLAYSLAIHLNANGEDHPAVPARYDQMGLLAYLQCRYAEAQQYHVKARQVKLRNERENLPNFAITEWHLGNAVAAQGRLEEALEVHNTALGHAREVRGEDHPWLGHHYVSLARVQRQRAQLEAALALAQSAVDVASMTHGDDLSVTPGLIELGNVLRDMGRFDDAVDAHRRALASLEASEVPKGNRRFGAAKVALGRSLCEAGRLDEGVAMLQDGVAILDAALGAAHCDVIEARTTLAPFARAE